MERTQEMLLCITRVRRVPGPLQFAFDPKQLGQIPRFIAALSPFHRLANHPEAFRSIAGGDNPFRKAAEKHRVKHLVSGVAQAL